MKKLFASLMIIFIMMACNNSSNAKKEITADSANSESPLMDAISTADSVNKEIKAGKDSVINHREEPKEPVEH